MLHLRRIVLIQKHFSLPNGSWYLRMALRSRQAKTSYEIKNKRLTSEDEVFKPVGNTQDTNPSDIEKIEKKDLGREKAIMWATDMAKKLGIPIENLSLCRGMALNRFVKDFFIYPEHTETESTNNILVFAMKLRKDLVDSVLKNHETKEMDELWKKHKLMALIVPSEFGGTGMCKKDLLVICEALSNHWASFLRFEQAFFAVSLLLQYGSPEQQAYYLPKVASGEMVPTLCIQENDMDFDDLSSLSTISVKNNNEYEVSGRKENVLDASVANMYLVVAKNKSDDKVSCFVVEWNHNKERITMTSRLKTLVPSAIDVRSVTFENAHVESTGEFRAGKEIAYDLCFSRNILFGAAVVGFLKTLIGNLSTHCNVSLSHNMCLSKKHPVKQLMTELALQTYVLESVCYYIGGLMDENVVVMFDVEEAAVQLMSKKLLHEAFGKTLEIAGLSAFSSPLLGFDKLFADIATILSMNSADRDVHDYIASKIITSYANTKAKDIRNWRSFNGRLLRRALNADWEAGFEHPKLRHYIAEHAHPSLKTACCHLEETMFRMDLVLQNLLNSHGKDLIDHYPVLHSISEIIQNVLGMTATISRASRSFSIGLRNGDLEVEWTTLYCSQAACSASVELKNINLRLEYEKLNPLRTRIGMEVCEAGGYCMESPLTRNW